MNYERTYDLNETRIKKNDIQIWKSQNRQFKYRLIQCSIAAAAILSSSCSVLLYRNAPVNDVLINSVGEIVPIANDSNISFSGRLSAEIMDGRYITEDGANKSYEATAIKEDNGFFEEETVDVPVYYAASKIDRNYFHMEEIEVEPNTYISAITLPSPEETTKDISVLIASLVGGILGCKLCGNVISEEQVNEQSLKAENRKMMRKNRRIKRSKK